MVPMSFAWTGAAVILATATNSPTARNLFSTEMARLAIGPTDDVVLIDARLDRAAAVHTASSDIADTYARQSDWDPRYGTDLPSHYFLLRPVQIQAWRFANELPGRTIMRDGRWLDDP
jgi:hypothetical protein